MESWDFNTIIVQKASCKKYCCSYYWGRLTQCSHLVTFKDTGKIEKMRSHEICNFLCLNGESEKIPQHLAHHYIFPNYGTETDIIKSDENKINEAIIEKQREEIKKNLEEINKQKEEIKINNDKIIELQKSSCF